MRRTLDEKLNMDHVVSEKWRAYEVRQAQYSLSMYHRRRREVASDDTLTEDKRDSMLFILDGILAENERRYEHAIAMQAHV